MKRQWLQAFQKAVERLGVEVVDVGDGACALRHDTSDFVEVLLQHGPLRVWVGFHESWTAEASPAAAAGYLISGRYSTTDAVSEWHWNRQGVGTELDE
jgi:hypothetical protein